MLKAAVGGGFIVGILCIVKLLFSKIETSHGKVSELVSNSLDDRGSVLASFPKFQDVASQPFPIEVLFKLAYQLPEGGQNTIIHLTWTSIEPNSQALSFPFRF